MLYVAENCALFKLKKLDNRQKNMEEQQFLQQVGGIEPTGFNNLIDNLFIERFLL